MQFNLQEFWKLYYVVQLNCVVLMYTEVVTNM